MPVFLNAYGDTEGPLGIPMMDRQAKDIERILRTLPQEDRKLHRLVTAKTATELSDGERSDVSWITTEAVDADKEIVIAKGMNDSQFAANPIVTMQHCYDQPPIGRSLWRMQASRGPSGPGDFSGDLFADFPGDNDITGIKAKTHYPPRPPDWTADCWPPDAAFSLIKAGLLNGKSIGFLCLAAHAPSSREIAARPELVKVQRIIDKWLLIEYACAFFPANPVALVEQVIKSRIAVPSGWLPSTAEVESIPFTTLSETDAVIRRSVQSINLSAYVKSAVHDAIDRVRGRV